ncbi:MAG TPA: hypothetical protein VM364_00770 [Vicinamibacterales bacterium]|nr:hypothetical protein [Vicinamibacterales bacterium]
MATETEVVTQQPMEATVLLQPKNRAEIDAERAALVLEAERGLPDEIASPAEYTAVGELEVRLNGYVKKFEPVFDDHVAKARSVWQTACAIRDVFIKGPKDFAARCRRLRGDYERKQEQIRLAEERRLAEEERQRQLAQRNAEAKLLEKQGQKEMAAAVRQQPVLAPSVTLPSAVPTVAGVRATRKNWTWRIAGCTDAFGGRKDPAARKRAAALVPREYLTLDDAALTAIAKSMKGTVKIPGIEFYEEKV